MSKGIVKSYIVGPLGTNCYIYTDSASGESVVIDPGFASPRFMEKLPPKVKYILLTHAHIDHIMGAYAVIQKTGAKVVAHLNESERMRSADENLYKAIGAYDEPFHPIAIDEAVDDGSVITLGDTVFTVIHTPGHTDGSVCYVTDEYVFSGDTLFLESYGRVDFKSGSMSSMIDSYCRLMQIEGDRLVYPGHMGTTTLSGERLTNPLKRYL